MYFIFGSVSHFLDLNYDTWDFERMRMGEKREREERDDIQCVNNSEQRQICRLLTNKMCVTIFMMFVFFFFSKIPINGSRVWQEYTTQR